MKKAYSSYLVDHTIITFNFVIFSLLLYLNLWKLMGLKFFSSFSPIRCGDFCKFYSSET